MSSPAPSRSFPGADGRRGGLASGGGGGGGGGGGRELRERWAWRSCGGSRVSLPEAEEKQKSVPPPMTILEAAGPPAAGANRVHAAGGPTPSTVSEGGDDIPRLWAPETALGVGRSPRSSERQFDEPGGRGTGKVVARSSPGWGGGARTVHTCSQEARVGGRALLG